MPWQVSILFFTFLSSSRAILNRKIGLNKQDLTLYALVASFICVFSGGVLFTLLSNQTVNHALALEAWPRLVFGGTLFAAINVMVLKLFRYVPASIAVFISLLNTLSVILFAYIFTDENLNQLQWLGALLLFFVIVLVGYISHRNNKVKKHQNILLGVLLAVMTALLFGPAIVNESYLIGTLGLETYLVYGWGLQATMSLLLAFVLKDRKRKKLKLPLKTHVLIWTYGGLLGAAGLMFTMTLDNSGSSSITAVAATASVALSVVLAYFFLHEKDDLALKLLGLVLAGCGLTLLFI
jgi:drug/metabolite transporter (DMT)-like permease